MNRFSMTRRQFRNRQPNDNGGGKRPPLTHFISLPIGHHTALRQSVSSFTGGLLHNAPELPGFDRTIVVPPRRLHLTLGVMSLEESDTRSDVSRKTLSEALSLLTSLGPRVSEQLRGARLTVPLQMMDIMPPDGGDPDKAHVLWLGPSRESEDARLLWEVGEMVNTTFREAGFIMERRPLKLHCTILNTTYRQPRARGPRQPFSYRCLLESAAAQGVVLDRPGVSQPVRVDFGCWNVDEIQICRMGSYGPEGEYERCGGLALGGPV